MSNFQQMIEVRRVLSDNLKNNTKSEPEVLDLNLISSFRGWHKGNKDAAIAGPMTIIVLKDIKNNNNEKNEDGEDKKRVIKTMLIEESYTSFLERMSTKVVIKRLNDELT